MLKRRNWFLIGFIGLTGVAVACGGKGSDKDGGDGDGDGDTGDGDTGDGDTGDGDTGDGDTGDGDTGDGDGSIGGAGGETSSMGGFGGEMTSTGGMTSTDGVCTGTPVACDEQTNCAAAGCSLGDLGCSGEAGCEELEDAPACTSVADELTCSYGPLCSGEASACSMYMNNLTCGEVDGCTWQED